jgi:hypothetical protein
MEQAQASPSGKAPAGWRFRLGMILFVLGMGCPLLAPLVLALDLGPGLTATLSGGLMLGIPDVLLLAAAAVMGKEGFNYLKDRLYALLRKAAPPQYVGPVRYTVGIVMFVIPLLTGWLFTYLYDFVPFLWEHHILFAVSGDVMFLASLWVLGGDFWDKLAALFHHRARATLPPKAAA